MQTAEGNDPAILEGEPLLQAFTPRDYHADTQCWSVVQDARGVIYVGNQALVLEYDSASWRQIPAGAQGVISALAYEPATDIIYVGSLNNLGYLKLMPGASRAFVSLLDQLPADERTIGKVRGVYATPAGVFFVGTGRVMRWREGRFKTWQLGASKLQGGWVEGCLYVQAPDVGLLRLENESFVPAADDPVFRRAQVCAVIPGTEGDLLVGTYHDGLYTLRDGVARPWTGALAGFLREKGMIDLLRLRDGSIAVATYEAGLLLLDREGRFRSHVDKVGGLHGNNLLKLFEDAEGGLWIGLESGVTRAEVQSPLSVLRGGPEDVLSNVQCDAHLLGSLVLGTPNGLYRVIRADPATATTAHLERVPGIDGAVYSAVGVPEGLLMVYDNKVVLLDAQARSVPVFSPEAEVVRLRASRLHPERVYATDDGGHVTALQLDEATHRWISKGKVAETGENGDFDLAETPPGSLWLGTRDHGLFHVQMAAGQPPRVTSLRQTPGPLRDERFVVVSDQNGSPFFATSNKLYRLDERGDNVRLATEFGSRFVDGSFRCLNLYHHDPSELWITGNHTASQAGDQARGRATAGDGHRSPVFKSLPHKVEDVFGLIQGYASPDQPPAKLRTLLLAGSTGNGIVCLDVARWEAEAAPPFSTLIRGATTIDPDVPASQHPPILSATLPYARNSVHFAYAANTFAFGAAPQFQTRLVNLGRGQWSDLTDQHSVDYLNLPEGGYTFEVRARDADGRPGQVASFPLRILPPWQRSPAAYAVYALAVALAVGVLLWWRGWQLRRRNVTLAALVEARTSELRGREVELVHARDQANAANRAKSAFLANMTHELRTPLNAILGYTQILLKDPELSARNRERITTVDRSGAHLLSMINEVLDLSKVEAGKLTLLPTSFALEALLDDLCAAFRPRFAEKGLTFEHVRAPGLPTVIHADAGKLRQVLFNLLGNALKFTRQGMVRLEVGPVPGAAQTVRFAVADTGVGIASEELRHIFLAFHQTGGQEVAAQGTGLGLSISQRLVELLGGHLQVESTPHQGSRFWFDLLLPPVAAAGDLLTAQTEPSQRPAVVGFHGPARRLLIVDDEAVNRRVLVELLAPLGFETEEAADGEECLARCAAHPPDALLLDLRMGRVGGLEVARTLRGQGAAVCIVAVSASVFADDRQQAIEAGCDDFLPKPFREEQLLEVLGRLLGLEWVRAEPANPSAIVPAPDAANFLRETDALIELARNGDILGLKTRFTALRDAGGIPEPHRPLARQLETLLAGYEIDRVYDLLVEFKRHANN